MINERRDCTYATPFSGETGMFSTLWGLSGARNREIDRYSTGRLVYTVRTIVCIEVPKLSTLRAASNTLTTFVYTIVLYTRLLVFSPPQSDVIPCKVLRVIE